MPPLTLLIALGDDDRDRIDTIADTVATIVGDRDASVIVGHALTADEYERAVDTLAEHVDNAGPQAVAGRPETASVHVTPSGEASETSTFESEQADLTPAAAARRIIGQKALVRDLLSSLEAREITAEVRGTIDDPAAAIEAMIEETEPDFVLVGGRDRSPTRQALFGSVSQQIIRTADCPVVTIRSQAT